MPFWDQQGEGRPRELHLLNYLTVAILIRDTVHALHSVHGVRKCLLYVCTPCACAFHVIVSEQDLLTTTVILEFLVPVVIVISSLQIFNHAINGIDLNNINTNPCPMPYLLVIGCRVLLSTPCKPLTSGKTVWCIECIWYCTDHHIHVVV